MPARRRPARSRRSPPPRTCSRRPQGSRRRPSRPLQLCQGSDAPSCVSRHRYVENREGEKNVNAAVLEGPSRTRPRAGHDRGVDVLGFERCELRAERGERRGEALLADEVVQLERIVLEVEQLAISVVVLDVLVSGRHDSPVRTGSRLVGEERDAGTRSRALAHPLAMLDQDGGADAARGVDRGAGRTIDRRRSSRIPPARRATARCRCWRRAPET